MTLRDVLVSGLEKARLKEPAKSFLGAVKTFGIRKTSPIIRDVLEHDTKAFTQGLAIHDGHLYESTGLLGYSSLRQIDLKTGVAVKTVPVENVWAEGIAIRENRFIQLTFTSRMAFVYRLGDLKLDNTISYDGEGWGLTAVENGYAMTNGTHNVFLRDENFSVSQVIPVHINIFPLFGLNDITYAKGMFYVCVLYDTNIYEICSRTGAVTAVIDCSSLVKHARPQSSEDVLNGLCYDESSGSFYVTGKRWRCLFNIEIAFS